MPIEQRASRLPLLMKCPGPLFLPVADEVPDEERDKSTAWGTMAHKWKETGRVMGPNKRTETAFINAVKLSGIDRETLWPSRGVHETQVAVRIDGVREVRDTHEGVLGHPDWITGTDDFHWYLLDGELWIDDLKTGKWYDDGEGGNRFPQDPRSAQLRLYALAVSRLLGYVGAVHVSVTHWPRLPVEFRHRYPIRYWTEYHTDELERFWDELEQLHRDKQAGAAGDMRLVPGDHCRFCPARDACLVAETFEKPTYPFRSRV